MAIPVQLLLEIQEIPDRDACQLLSPFVPQIFVGAQVLPVFRFSIVCATTTAQPGSSITRREGVKRSFGLSFAFGLLDLQGLKYDTLPLS